jgi:hypothetical protein
MTSLEDKRYVPADPKAVRIAVAFFVVWVGIDLLCASVGQGMVKQLDAAPPESLNRGLLADSFRLLVLTRLPDLVGILLQASFSVWLGLRTYRAGIHSPPQTKLPFKVRVRSGVWAKWWAVAYFTAAAVLFGCALTWVWAFHVLAKVI